MKKFNMILSIILTIAMVFSLTACVKVETPPPTTVTPSPVITASPVPVTPSPIVTPVPTRTPTPGESLFQPDVPSIKKISPSDIDDLTGSGTYYVSAFRVDGDYPFIMKNDTFSGKLIFNEITSALAVSILVPMATVELTKDIAVPTLSVATSPNTLRINDATLNISYLIIKGGNAVIENSTINGTLNIIAPPDTTTTATTSVTITSSVIDNVNIENLNSAIDVKIAGNSQTLLTNSNTVATTLSVAGTSRIAVENTASGLIALEVSQGAKPSLTIENKNQTADTFKVKIPQDANTSPNITTIGTGTVTIKDDKDQALTAKDTAPVGVAFLGTDAATSFIFQGKQYTLTPGTNIATAIADASIHTIFLVGDISPSALVNVTKPMTIDLGGFTIGAGISFNTGSQGSTIKNGTVDLKGDTPFYSDGSDAPVIYVSCGGTTTIANMTLKSNGLAVDTGIVNSTNDNIIVSNTTIDITSTADDNVNAIYLNRGTLSAPDALYVNLVAKTGFNTFGVAYANGAEVTSLKSIQSPSNNPTAHLRAYYLADLAAETAAIAHAKTLLGENQIFAISNADGTTFYQGTSVQVTNVATLKKALAAGGTVKLLNDITLSDTDATFAVNNTVVLDLNGKTISGAAFHVNAETSAKTERGIIQINARGNLTLTSTAANKGKITVGAATSENYSTVSLLLNYGTLTVENTIVESNTNVYYAITAWTKSILNIKEGADIYGNAGNTDGIAISANGKIENEGWTINIEDGAIVRGNEQAMYLPSKGTLNIFGGAITGKARGVEMRAGTIKMTGGTITADSARDNSYVTTNGGSGAVTGALVLVKSKYTTDTGYNGAIVANLTGCTLSNSTGDALVIVKEVKTSGSHPSDSTITVTYSGTTIITGGTYTAGEDITITPPQT